MKAQIGIGVVLCILVAAVLALATEPQTKQPISELENLKHQLKSLEKRITTLEKHIQQLQELLENKVIVVPTLLREEKYLSDLQKFLKDKSIIIPQPLPETKHPLKSYEPREFNGFQYNIIPIQQNPAKMTQLTK